MNSNHTKIIFGLFCFLQFQLPVFAQSGDVEFQSWVDITMFFDVNEKIGIGGDFGTRGIISSSDWSQYYVRPTFRYVINPKIDVAVGAALFYTKNATTTDVMEFRFYQEINFDWPNFKSVWFNHRIRFEQRMFNYAHEDQINYTNHSSTRLRYSILGQTKDLNLLNQKIYFVGGGEYFQIQQIDAESYINQSRIVAIIGHRISDRIRYEVHYVYQSSRLFQDDGLQGTEHILRLRFFRTPKFLNRIEQ